MIYYLLYDFLFFVVLVVFFPFIWRRIKSEKGFPGDWKERFAIFRRDLKKGKNKRIWIHTVSVGEFLSINPLLEKLKSFDVDIVVSLTTKTGRKVAESKISDIKYFFFPFDFYPIMERAISFLKPDLIVIVETEIWINLIRIARRKNIPIVMINGRLSPRSFKRYKHFRFITRKILPHLTKIAMRTEEEKEKIIYLGADRNKVMVCGSMKFDLAYQLSMKINAQQFREKIGIDKNKKIVVFGSIHPEEEEPIAQITKEIIEEFNDWIVIIVPRFLDRSRIFKILYSFNIQYVRRTQMEGDFKVLVVDTYGELNHFYAISEFAFVGGSLNGWGGQNPIEPIAFKKAVVYGKDNWHFFVEWKKIKEGGGGIEVKDFSELKEKVKFLINNPEICHKIGENGFKVLVQNTGATEINFNLITQFL